MAQKFFDLLNRVFLLMSENKLRKNIDDTLLEKLLTILKKCKFQQSLINDGCIVTDENNQNIHFDFIEELVKRTTATHLIEKVLCSVAEKDANYTDTVKAFGIRLLGLIYESPKELFSFNNLMTFPVLRDKNKEIISNHIPSIQNALIACLSSITKQLKGALWFIDYSLEEFIFSSFNSSSYYVRKSASSFFVDFITKWAQTDAYEIEQIKTEELHLKEYLRKIMSYIIKQIHLYRNLHEINFAECCILVTRPLLKLDNSEEIMGNTNYLAKEISECFSDVPDEERFISLLIDFFLAVSFKSKSAKEVVTDVMKYLLIKEDMKLAYNLATSYANIAWRIEYERGDIRFFLLPVGVLRNALLIVFRTYFRVGEREIMETLCKKMENKSDCKLLFCLSLSATRKLLPYIYPEDVQRVTEDLFKVISHENPNRQKLVCSVLEDRSVHQCLVDLFKSLLSDDVVPEFIFNGNDLLFKIIMELLKKPTSDNNYLSQLLLVVKDLFILHERRKFNLIDADKDAFIQVLCRMLLDNRESVVDSALHLSGHMLCCGALPSWKEMISKHSIHSIIWDIAIHGSHDGSVRSTALKAIIAGCLGSWCLDEIKSLKGVTEIDIVKILFDLTYDPDYFLQRDALTCLYLWMKSKWNDLPPSSKEYLFSALVSAVKSLDLELKLISLGVWCWLMKHKFTYSGDPSEVKEYIEKLTESGCGLSLIIACEDYDEAVKFKAANILLNLKNKLTICSVSIDSLNVNSPVEEPVTCHIPIKLQKPFTLEERDEGIDSVMEITTTEQITKICRPPNLSDLYDFRQEYFSVDSKNRACPVSLFWKHLWSEDLVSMVHPAETLSDINSECESLLNDIIAAKVSELKPIEETLDCY